MTPRLDLTKLLVEGRYLSEGDMLLTSAGPLKVERVLPERISVSGPHGALCCINDEDKPWLEALVRAKRVP